MTEFFNETYMDGKFSFLAFRQVFVCEKLIPEAKVIQILRNVTESACQKRHMPDLDMIFKKLIN